MTVVPFVTSSEDHIRRKRREVTIVIELQGRSRPGRGVSRAVSDGEARVIRLIASKIKRGHRPFLVLAALLGNSDQYSILSMARDSFICLVICTNVAQ